MKRLIHKNAFFGFEGNAANPGPGYNTLLLQLIPGDLYIACLYRKFHTIPGLLHSQSALPSPNSYVCVPSREAVCTIFMIVFGMTQPGHEPTEVGGGNLLVKLVISNHQAAVGYATLNAIAMKFNKAIGNN